MKMSEFFEKPFPTPFDNMDFKIDATDKGGYIRDKLLEFENRFGEVTELSTIAGYKAEVAKARWDMALDIAMLQVDEDCKEKRVSVSMKKSMARTKEVTIPGDTEKTTPYKEEHKYYAFSYIAQRGKDKVRELNNMLDLGRSVLSWDKQELERLER